VISYYSKFLNNLSCNATQRSESYHSFIKAIINEQLSFDDAVVVISNKTYAIYKLLSINEDRALIDADLILNTQAFKFLINTVSIKAIRLIEEE
jgi:predicted nucleic acid-binding protein